MSWNLTLPVRLTLSLPRMASCKREILLVVYSEKRNNVPAHWSMLITDEIGGKKGTKIHAIGSPFFGYAVEMKDSYDLSTTGRLYSKTLLGLIDEAQVVRFTTVAKSTEAPGVSKTPLDPFGVRYAYHLSCLRLKY
jgi:hypothetical protein